MVPCVSHGSLMWVFLNGEWFSPESDSTPPTFGTQRACQVASKWGKYGETPSASFFNPQHTSVKGTLLCKRGKWGNREVNEPGQGHTASK